jgi:hypothetical protein
MINFSFIKNVDFSSIIKFLKNPTTQRVLLVAVVIILILLWRKDIAHYTQKVAFVKQNTLALNSELRTWKSKANTYLTERFSLVGEVDSLKNYSQSLKSSIDRIKKEKKGGVISGEEIDVTVDNGGTKTETKNDYDVLTKSGTLYWEINKKEDGFSRLLVGRTPYKINVEKDINVIAGDTFIEKDIYELGLNSYTILNKDNTVSFIVESKNKNVKITDVNQYIDPDHIKKLADIYYVPPKYSVSLGMHGGFGINPTGNLLQPVPYIGIGININIVELFRF